MLTGTLVRLRALTAEDAEAHWRWNNDPAVMRFMSAGYPTALDRFRADYPERYRVSYEKVVLAIETVDDGRFVGLVALTAAEPENGGAEFDIYVGEKDCWGRGYGTEATRLICRYGFDRMRLHRITLWVALANEAAIRVYEKVGFEREGVARESFREGGRWHDMVLMGLLDGELRD